MGALRRLGHFLGLVYRDELPADPIAAGRPWWYFTRTTGQSAFIGGQAAFGLVGLMLYALGGLPIWLLLLSCWWLVYGGIFLASAVARYRHERSRSAPRTIVPPGAA
jgi:hypothetical protein